MSQQVTMEVITSLAKRRGFIFQGSEIYGGLAGTYDYGPLGVLLKNNIRDSWIATFVGERTDMYLLDAAILMSPKVWETTGHVDQFVDPLVEDLMTNKRYRADLLLEEIGVETKGMTLEAMNDAIAEQGITSPDGNELGPVRTFNMMLGTKVGTIDDSAAMTYLRPETAQGIFVNFKNIIDTFHPRLPFGVAQVGKAFRNEITPRDFIFRVREFEQMEIEYFVREEEWQKHFDVWHQGMQAWSESVGIDMGKTHSVDVPESDRAHYSKKTIDMEFEYPFGQKELFGLAYRTNYDLGKHMKASGAKLDYLDDVTGERFVPHVIEPSFGLDRAVLAVMLSSYTEDTVGEEARVYMNFPAHIAPYKVAVSPLLRNKEELVGKARDVYASLKKAFHNVAWDDNGNIGKRYRRQDEIGTPYCVVVDHDSLEDGAVTVRDRNTTNQERIAIDELVSWLSEKFT